ncbi:MAG: uracil-DNA glycosylase [Candidatus Aminicenantes bacterium]|nr:uracil-DNA glycosylase [Candidatus Aminicenantes bacterium]
MNDPREKSHLDIREHLKFFSELAAEFFVQGEEAPPPSENSPLKALEERVLGCLKCPLAKTRTQAVPGEGNAAAALMFVGEGPGHDEDVQGRPFVGRAGQLLTKIINAMGFQRMDVYITNMVKCRPPNNRNPNSQEIELCQDYLFEQIEMIQPRVIVTLGNVPTQYFLKTRSGITSLRGKFHDSPKYRIMPTFHPSYLIRNEGNRELRRQVWDDMQQVMSYLKE